MENTADGGVSDERNWTEGFGLSIVGPEGREESDTLWDGVETRATRCSCARNLLIEVADAKDVGLHSIVKDDLGENGVFIIVNLGETRRVGFKCLDLTNWDAHFYIVSVGSSVPEMEKVSHVLYLVHVRSRFSDGVQNDIHISDGVSRRDSRYGGLIEECKSEITNDVVEMAVVRVGRDTPTDVRGPVGYGNVEEVLPGAIRKVHCTNESIETFVSESRATSENRGPFSRSEDGDGSESRECKRK